MKIYLPIILSSFISALLFASAVNAQVASATPYTLEQSVIAGGGGTSSAGNTFSITGTIGQAVAGTTSTNSPFAVSGGFFTAAPAAIAPTAAGATISGRVRTADGKGIRNVLVTLTEADGTTRTTLSAFSGRYIFADVAAGQTIILSAAGKRFSFSQPMQVLNLTEDVNDIDFIAIEQGVPIKSNFIKQ